LDRLKGDENIIIFYTEGCEVCAAEKAAAQELLSRADDAALSDEERTKYKNMNVFMVNVDALMASDPSLASRLMDSFDLSSLPFIIRTDRSGTVLNRYVSFQ
jgi:thiol-disulfide isomerase/thioredoxin